MELICRASRLPARQAARLEAPVVLLDLAAERTSSNTANILVPFKSIVMLPRPNDTSHDDLASRTGAGFGHRRIATSATRLLVRLSALKCASQVLAATRASEAVLIVGNQLPCTGPAKHVSNGLRAPRWDNAGSNRTASTLKAILEFN